MEDKALSYTDLLSGLRYDKFTSRLYNFLFLFLCCKKNIKQSAQRGARTHDPEIKSLMLYRLS